jgi:hypothetical protein
MTIPMDRSIRMTVHLRNVSPDFAPERTSLSVSVISPLSNTHSLSKQPLSSTLSLSKLPLSRILSQSSYQCRGYTLAVKAVTLKQTYPRYQSYSSHSYPNQTSLNQSYSSQSYPNQTSLNQSYPNQLLSLLALRSLLTRKTVLHRNTSARFFPSANYSTKKNNGVHNHDDE